MLNLWRDNIDKNIKTMITEDYVSFDTANWHGSCNNNEKNNKTMKIYRAEICGSQDSCAEFWETFPLTDFYTTKEDVEKKIAHLKGLKGRDLEKAIEREFDVCAYFGRNEPVIEGYTVVED